MKAITRLAAGLAGLAALAACVSPPASPAPPPPAPAPAPAPAPPPPPEPPASWEDGAPTAGDWRYVEGPEPHAAFGAGAPILTVICTAYRQIRFVRAGPPAADALSIRTAYGARSIPASARPDATVATLPPSDPLLDQIAFSRGRFLVQVEGQSDLVLPSWPEPARVIDECRGQ